ncbi:MAG: MoaD/ThiS family protein [Planctomycetaceae bacterium]|jgi:molybdopterin converting factor subunit 1|nr:MoaD/ThiS family protein [Planctomycetaceae bacterium]MBT4012549.1 MoaD/ThiS family protein [Planctomycetaceae bacterium]MBT4724282.1 MoaD/ThiS family protein [Planctomycetaceae bacterium]MBT5125979.1 MoaD/ThiS family protein [Planctomycetaceae bacterium]MBT5600577.1 MoaD/ThiS family protein [Planctomycetaceae bacterium]
MTLKIKLFAAAAQAIGNDHVRVASETPVTIQTLKLLLAEQHPSLESILPYCRFAVNHEFALDEDAVSADHELALIPPVSGG